MCVLQLSLCNLLFLASMLWDIACTCSAASWYIHAIEAIGFALMAAPVPADWHACKTELVVTGCH